jgi:hypothetical protein
VVTGGLVLSALGVAATALSGNLNVLVVSGVVIGVGLSVVLVARWFIQSPVACGEMPAISSLRVDNSMKNRITNRCRPVGSRLL